MGSRKSDTLFFRNINTTLWFLNVVIPIILVRGLNPFTQVPQPLLFRYSQPHFRTETIDVQFPKFLPTPVYLFSLGKHLFLSTIALIRVSLPVHGCCKYCEDNQWTLSFTAPMKNKWDMERNQRECKIITTYSMCGSKCTQRRIIF